MTARVPMLVLGGFLGAGKTTLLNRLLAGRGGLRSAVLVNDFGDLDVDGALVTAHDGETIRFANGCLCCAMGDDLVGAIDRLLAGEEQRPDRFVVEASGVADPAAIADVATLHPELRRDLVVVLADVETLRARYEDRRLRETIARQLHAADLLVLNKCDRVSERARKATASWAREHVSVPITHTIAADVPVELLSSTPTDPAGATASAGAACGSGLPAGAEAEAVEGTERHGTAAEAGEHGHGFVSRTVACPDPIDPGRLRAALASLEPRVLRAKGFVVSARDDPASEGEWILVQACGRTVELSPWRPPRGNARPAPAIVFIGLDDLPSEPELTRAVRKAEIIFRPERPAIRRNAPMFLTRQRGGRPRG